MKNALTLFSLFICISLTGCAGHVFPMARDITNVQLMRTMALDEGEGDNTLVTVSGGVRAGDEGSKPQPPVILSWEAPTVFGACLTMQTYGDGYVSYGHVGQCVAASDVMRENAAAPLDFVERDFEMRMDTDLYITQGKAADILVETASETSSATERLDSIERDLALKSEGWRVSIRDFLIDIEENGCALVPVLRLKEEEEGETIACDEMGWFSDDGYRGRLSPTLSRAAAILTDHGGSGAVETTLSDGTLAGLRLTDERCQWEPTWENGRITGLTARVRVRADIAELRGPADVYEEAVQAEMNEGLSATLKRELEELLTMSQRNNADFLHLSRSVQMKCPSRYREIQRNWDDWFPKMSLTVEVDSVIERSYDMNQGSGR